MKKLIAILAAACLLFSAAALADSVTVNGAVVSTQSEVVAAPIGGTVRKLLTTAGTHVSAQAPLIALSTTVVYAQEDGTARLFGEPGDQTESVAARYGAVVYVEPDYHYTISASTRYAYDTEENKVIHPGEQVYLRSYNDAGKRTGTGVVNLVSGSTFNVEVTSGSFNGGEAVVVYRSSAYATSSRIGRGSATRTDPIAYTGEGSIVRFCVEDGAAVKKGDALFETLNGEFDHLSMTGDQVLSPVEGIVASLSVNPGDTLEKGAVTAEIYPDSAMRIEASVSEANLRYFALGSEVTVEFPYLGAEPITLPGTVERISFLADGTTDDEESEEAWYLLYVDFEPVEGIRYGMSALITLEQ